jgi:Zn/Cd-binding protein ZinT
MLFKYKYVLSSGIIANEKCCVHYLFQCNTSKHLDLKYQDFISHILPQTQNFHISFKIIPED